MKTKEVKKLPTIQRLIYWIKERHSVFLRKESNQPKPWTDDEIIRDSYFCNPYRENDRTTRWLADNVRNPLSARENNQVAFAVLAFRWFNYIPTGCMLAGGNWLEGGAYSVRPDQLLKSLLINWNSDRACQAIQELQYDIGKVFTGAFTISPSGSTKPKVERVIYDYIHPVHEEGVAFGKRIRACKTLEEAFNYISKFPGMAGGFMCAQVIADLRYTHLLRHATDAMTWCCLGPGSTRGLNIVMGRDPASNAASVKEVLYVQDCINKQLPKNMPLLHAQDVQNCLCEFFKYERCLWGFGKSKRKYNGKK